MKKIILIIIALFSFGCAAKVDMVITSPAKNDDLLDYKNIAVYSVISQDKQQDYTDKFEDAISEITYDEKKYFNVKKDKFAKKLRADNSLSIDNPQSVIDSAKELGVDGFWVGNIIEDYKNEEFKRTKNTCMDVGIGGPDDNCGSILVFCNRRNIVVTGNMQLLDGETGIVVYSDTISSTLNNESCSDDKKKTTDDDVKKRAIDMLIENFTMTIAPHQEKLKIELISNKDGIFDDLSKEHFSAGISFAKEGRMDKACNSWKIAYERNPKAVGVMYNMAVCYEYETKYEEALSLLEELDKILPPASFSDKFHKYFKFRDLPNNLVLDAIDRNKKHIKDKEILDNQLKKI